MMLDYSKAVALLALVSMFCGWTGSTALRWLAPPVEALGDWCNRYCIAFVKLCLGLAVLALLLFGLGVTGHFSPGGIATGMLGLAAVGLGDRKRPGVALPASQRWRAGDGLLLAGLGGLVLLASSHAPGHWDDTMYHLPLARSYVEHQALVLEPFLRFPLFPQNMNLLMGLGLMAAGELGAQVMATLPLGLVTLGLLGLSLGLTGSVTTGVLAALATWLSGPVLQTLGYAYVDNGLAMFVLGAIVALGFWLETRTRQRSTAWLVAAGILAGAAAGTKYFGLVAAGLLGLYVIAHRLDWKAAAAYGLACATVSVGWYVRSYWLSGDPVHPAGGNLFGHFLWNAQDLLAQRQEQATHGVSVQTLNVPGALHKAGALGLTLGLLSLWWSRPPAILRVMRFFFLAYLAFWFAVTQVDRYLSPIIPVGSFLAVHAVARLGWLREWASSPGGSRIARPAARLLVLASLAVMTLASWRNAQFTPDQWQAAMSRRAGYSLLQKANESIPTRGGRLVQVGFENAIYYFNGVAIGDWFGPGRYSDWLSCDQGGCGLVAPDVLIQNMHRLDARMLAISTARFQRFDPADYQDRFEVLQQDPSGVLLALRDRP